MHVLLIYIPAFLVALTVLVFVHEYGHYWVARRCGVKVETFSIGFGPELFGWTARSGTRWKVSAIPLGGYVKMFGDADETSRPSGEPQTPEERAVSFHAKSVGQRAAIIAAGPMANFLFAAVGLAILFATVGHPLPPPTIHEVQPGSPAEAAGFLPGDRIVSVDGIRTDRFSDVVTLIQASDGFPVTVTVQRSGIHLSDVLVPRSDTIVTADGREIERYRIGIAATTTPYPVLESAWMGVTETIVLIRLTLTGLGEIIVGRRGVDELGGPLRIAQISGDVAQVGFLPFFWLLLLLSVNLGLINLFPIPVLDGGHLVFLGIEAVRGKPMSDRAVEIGFKAGLFVVLGLMLFVTLNDLVQLDVIDFIRRVIS